MYNTVKRSSTHLTGVTKAEKIKYPSYMKNTGKNFPKLTRHKSVANK